MLACAYMHRFRPGPKPKICLITKGRLTKRGLDMSHVSSAPLGYGYPKFADNPGPQFHFLQQAPLKLVNTCVNSHIAKLNHGLLPKNGKPNIRVKPACGLTNCKPFNLVKLKTPKKEHLRDTQSQYVRGCHMIQFKISATHCYL